MAIDLHAHLARPDPEAPPFMRHLFDVDGYVERQAEAGLELTVLSYALHDLKGTPDELELARTENDHLAELVASHPDRFAALAGIDPFGGGPWLEEAERALDSGFAGFCFPTSRQGAYLDAPEAEEALALANDRSALVFIHPSESALDGRPGNALVEAWIGLPCDTGVCLSRLLLADTLSKHPNVRVVRRPLGGVLPLLLGRLDGVYEVLERIAALSGGVPPGALPGQEPAGPRGEAAAPLAPSVEGPPPSERTGQLYLDTATLHPAALRAAIEAVGVDRLVFGSDYPPAGSSPQAALELVNASGLSEDEREKVLSSNARQLLGR